MFACIQTRQMILDAQQGFAAPGCVWRRDALLMPIASQGRLVKMQGCVLLLVQAHTAVMGPVIREKGKIVAIVPLIALVK